MPTGERMSERACIGVRDGQEALGHGQKVYRHFVTSFPGLHSGKGWGEFPGQGLKLWTGLPCSSTHAI